MSYTFSYEILNYVDYLVFLIEWLNLGLLEFEEPIAPLYYPCFMLSDVSTTYCA